MEEKFVREKIKYMESEKNGRGNITVGVICILVKESIKFGCKFFLILKIFVSSFFS